jgi:hypothetical protein
VDVLVNFRDDDKGTSFPFLLDLAETLSIWANSLEVMMPDFAFARAKAMLPRMSSLNRILS